MLAIVMPTIVAIFAFAWWFRAANTQGALPPGLGLFGPHRTRRLVDPDADHHPARRRDLDRLAPARSGQADRGIAASRLRIQVVSLDWKWLFIYPDQNVASVNELVVPAGVPLHFALTSASVMNAFFVPQLGSMIYTMNGMTTQLNLQADQPGTYPGPLGAFQRRRLLRTCISTSMPWRRSNSRLGAGRRAGPTRSTHAAMRELAKASINDAPAIYRARRPGPVRVDRRRRNCRRRRARSRASNGRFAADGSRPMFGKLELGRHSARPADPADRLRRRRRWRILARPRPGSSSRACCPICGASGSPASTTSASA